MNKENEVKISDKQVDYFISRYEPLYYENDINRKDVPKLNTTEYEVEKYIESKLAYGIVDTYVVVWKTGRLKKEDIDNNEFLIKNDYVNGYGKKIKRNELELFFSKLKKSEIQRIFDVSDTLTREILEKSYNLVKENSPENFGSVYLINILFFLSKGKIPIYDKYAHMAVKALFFGEAPSNIYVGAPPDKNNTQKVINMLSEYMWYLNKLFGTFSITSSLDRALWVYGHSNSRFDVINKFNLSSK